MCGTRPWPILMSVKQRDSGKKKKKRLLSNRKNKGARNVVTNLKFESIILGLNLWLVGK